jgi:hypothetical protein
MPDSACAPQFVTMVTFPNIFEVVFRKERPEVLRLQQSIIIFQELTF